MTLPASFRFDPIKLTGYLLNPDHPEGGSKAKFFLGRGFTASAVLTFADCLSRQAIANWPGVRTVTQYAVKHAVTGEMDTPRGQAMVLTVWQVNASGEASLITARPYRT